MNTRVPTVIIMAYALIFALALTVVLVTKHSLASTVKSNTPSATCEGFQYRGAVVCDNVITNEEK